MTASMHHRLLSRTRSISAVINFCMRSLSRNRISGLGIVGSRIGGSRISDPLTRNAVGLPLLETNLCTTAQRFLTRTDEGGASLYRSGSNKIAGERDPKSLWHQHRNILRKY